MIILICEDNKNMLFHIENLINKTYLDDKIITKTAFTAKKALDIANSLIIDIFIIDLKLPDMNGLKLAVQLRQKYPYQPILIESEISNLKIKEVLQDKILNIAYLEKPFTDKNFTDKLAFAMELAKKFHKLELRITENKNITVYDVNSIIVIHKISNSKYIEIIWYDSILHQAKHLYNISDIINLLNPTNALLQVHRSFLINPIYISRVNYVDSCISLTHIDFDIPIGSKYLENLYSIVV